jgi:hypothetical protein
MHIRFLEEIMTSEEEDVRAKKADCPPKAPRRQPAELGSASGVLVCESCGHVESHQGEFISKKGWVPTITVI